MSIFIQFVQNNLVLFVSAVVALVILLVAIAALIVIKVRLKRLSVAESGDTAVVSEEKSVEKTPTRKSGQKK